MAVNILVRKSKMTKPLLLPAVTHILPGVAFPSLEACAKQRDLFLRPVPCISLTAVSALQSPQLAENGPPQQIESMPLMHKIRIKFNVDHAILTFYQELFPVVKISCNGAVVFEAVDVQHRDRIYPLSVLCTHKQHQHCLP